MEKLISIFEGLITKWVVYLIGMPIFLMAIVEALNGFGRKLWGAFPCAIEIVESLLVIIIFFGVSVVAVERGHVKIDLLTRKFPLAIQNYLTILTDIVGAGVFGLITWGAWKMAIYAVKIMEMRIAVIDFPIWPFKVIFAFGGTLFVIQLLINVVKSIYLIRGDTRYANVEKIQEPEEIQL